MYNANRLLEREIHPESGTTSYTYDDAGMLATRTDANGTVFTYTYDGNDRVTRIAAGTSVTEVAYEPGSDNRLSMSNQTASTAFVYDAAGRVQQRRDAIGAYVFNVGYQYSQNDQVTEITYPSGRKVGYEYNAEQQITRVFETAAGRDYAFGMTYHPSGALATYTAGNLLPTTITYDTSRYWTRSITSGPLQLTYDRYDAVGNVQTIGDGRAGMAQTFTYDGLDRLHTAVGAYGTLEYLYDAHGNRQTANGTTYEYWLGTLRLRQQGVTSFAYDNNGNLTTAGGSTYTYTPENWLASATVPGGAVAYGYDVDGRRVRRTAPAETVLYIRGEQGQLLTEWHNVGASARAREYVYAGSRLLAAIDRTSELPTACGGRSIPNGSPTPVSISTAGATGTVTFEGSACRRVSVNVDVTSGNFGCSWVVSILKPDGATLGSISGCATSTLLLEPLTLPVSGMYTVVVDPAGSSTGTANVYVYDVVDVTTPISANGSTVTAELTTPGQNTRLPLTGAAANG